MADETATLALGIDSSGFESGAKVLSRSATEIKESALAAAGGIDRLGQSMDQTMTAAERTAAVAAQQRVWLAAATKLTTEQTAAQDRMAASGWALAETQKAAATAQSSYNAKLAESRALGLAEIAAIEEQSVRTAAATARAAGSVGMFGAASTGAFGGTTRLIRSMDSMAFSAAGVHGPISTIVTSLGLMAAGSTLMLGLAAGAGELALIWSKLTGEAHKLEQETQKLIDTLFKAAQAKSGATAGQNISDTQDQLAKDRAKLAEIQNYPASARIASDILGASAGSFFKDYDAKLQEATLLVDKDRIALEELRKTRTAANDTDLQSLDLLKAVSAAHMMTTADYAKLNGVISDYAARTAKAKAALDGHTGSQKDYIEVLGKLTEAERLRNTDMKIGETAATKAATEIERQRAATEALTVVTQNSAVEQLKASGDVIGAARAEYAAQLEAIKSKYDHIVALGHLTQAAADKAISDQTDIVWTKAQITIGAELDKQRAQWAAASDKITNQAATNRELEAKFTRDGAQAFEDAYNLKLAKITEDLTKTTDAINARKDLTTAEKVWYDTIAIVTAGLQKRGVELQRNNDLEKLARDSAKELANAEEAYQVAVLNAAGKTKEAHALEIANRERNLELSLQQRVAAHGLTQEAADHIVQLSRATAQLNEYTASHVKNVDIARDLYKTLGRDIEHTLASTFDNVLTKGISSFAQLFGEIEKMFAKTIADLAAHALTADLAKSFGGLFGGASSTAGAVVTPGQTQPDGSPLALGAGWSTPASAPGGLSVGAATALVAGVAMGFVTSMVAAADALNAARLKWEASASAFDKTITDWATSISVTAGSFAATMAASAKTVAGYQAQAFGVFTAAPGTSGTSLSGLAANAQRAFDNGGMAGLNALEDFMRFVAEHTGKLQDYNAAIVQLHKDLALTADAAAKLAAIDLAAFLTGIQNAYTATLPGGANQLTLAGIETTRQNAANGIAAAEAPGGTLSVSDANAALATVQQTYTNQVQNFLKSLNQGDLETLIPTLTGATRAYAESLDAVLRVTQEATIIAQNATAAGGLYGRLAAASDGAVAKAYADKQHAQQQADEIAAATKKRDDDIAAHASAAAIASDNYTIALIKTTQATEDAWAAAKNLAAELAGVTALQVRALTATGDTAGAARLQRSITEATEVTAAITAGWSAADIAYLQYVQGLEDTKAKADKLIADTLTQRTFSEDILTRNARLSNDPESVKIANLNLLLGKEADERARANKLLTDGIITQGDYNRLLDTQNKERKSAMDSFDGTIGGVTQSVHDLAVAAAMLAANTNTLNQQWTVFGTGLKEQTDQLRGLLGFGGMSDDAIRSKFVREVNGTALTPEQKALDDNITQYFTKENAYLSSIPAAVAAAVAPIIPTSLAGAVTATYGSSTPIIGPNGNFHITIQVMVDPETAKNGAAISEQIARGVDKYFLNRANLVNGAKGGT